MAEKLCRIPLWFQSKMTNAHLDAQAVEACCAERRAARRWMLFRA